MQNPILQYRRFVASFNFDQIIDDAKMIEKSLSICSLFQIGYCNSNTIGTTTPNILISYLTYSKHKITNDQNTKIKFWWHEILNEFQGKTKHHHKTRVLIKAKALLEKKFNMTTLKFVKGVIAQSLKVQQYLVNLYLKFIGK